MLEDGKPYRTDEEIFLEIMEGAIKTAKQRKAKTASNRIEVTDPVLSFSVDKFLPPEIPSSKRKRENKKKSKQDGVDNKPGSGNKNNESTTKAEMDRSPAIRPRALPNCHNTASPLACAENNTNSNNEATSPSTDEGYDREKGIDKADSLPSANSKGKKGRLKTKRPKGLTFGATSTSAERSVVSKGLFSTKTETAQVYNQETTKNPGPGQSEEKASREQVPSIPNYRQKFRGLLKGLKHPKASEKEELYTLSPKVELTKVVGTNDNAHAPKLNDGSTECSRNTSNDPDHGFGTSDKLAASEKEMFVEMKEKTSAASEEDKGEMSSLVFRTLPENGLRKATQHCSELSAYVREEMKSLQEEIASLKNVTIKLESEMREAIEIKDCCEELDGLKQNWLIIFSHMDKLKTRKADLQILEKQEDLEYCCDVLRDEIKFLFTLEDWRRTDHHTLQEARLLQMLHCLEDKQTKKT